jgi:hypothetical protein
MPKSVQSHAPAPALQPSSPKQAAPVLHEPASARFTPPGRIERRLAGGINSSEKTQPWREPGFNCDFSQVPVHSLARADASTNGFDPCLLLLPGGGGPRPLPQLAAAFPAPFPQLDKPSLATSFTHVPPPLAALVHLAATREAAFHQSSSPTHSKLPEAGLGPGSPLPRALRGRLERAYGYQFDPVRLHTGSCPASIARGFGAAAITLGDHVLLGTELDPNTGWGNLIVGHSPWKAVTRCSTQTGAARS